MPSSKSVEENSTLLSIASINMFDKTGKPGFVLTAFEAIFIALDRFSWSTVNFMVMTNNNFNFLLKYSYLKIVDVVVGNVHMFIILSNN